MFVRALGGEQAAFGIGKLVERKGDLCVIEYFDAPMIPPVLVELHSSEVTEVTLPEQTRVYHFNAAIGAWEIGRLLDDHGDTQLIQFPNKSTRHLEVLEVYVRWARPIEDPTPFLANRVNESPRFSDGRSAFTRSQMAQRAASQGMSAILSSGIELESHQIEVVRRVLQDPVQRYLLADEVGLGKTIEAGILIRQCILDCGERAQIVILVPDALVSQWRGELAEKFHLGRLLDRQIWVIPVGDVEERKSALDNADMLVIDEAHHMTDEGIDGASYAIVAAAAHRSERVLLLSATPVLHNEQSFLAMLHLLDPDTYRLGDLSAFRQRIEARQSLAEIVAGLIPENALYLDYTIDAIAGLFPHDPLLQDHASRLRLIVEKMPAEDDPDLVEAIGRTRAHLSEVYRLHRRILRHRRRNIDGLTPDRSGVTIHRYRSPDRAALTLALEEWRFQQALAVERGEPPAAKARVGSFWKVVDQAARHTCSGLGMVGFLAKRADLIGDIDSFAQIPGLLTRKALFESRAALLHDVVADLVGRGCKCVVFCSDKETADALAAGMTSTLGFPVDRHNPDSGEWQAFNVDPARRVLVCDRTAEEGLNLQGGHKVVVHYDTPYNPNRIEQRLGRVDRYGSGESVHSHVLVCEDDPVEEAWTRYLDDALGVFSRSVAGLQYLIDQSVRDLAPMLFEEGVEGFEGLIDRHGGDDGLIAREIKAIDQQDALDALGEPPSELTDQLCDVDDAWQDIAQDTTLWLEQTLRFGHTHAGQQAINSLAAPFRYWFQTGRPHTLIPLPTFMAECGSSVDLTPAPGKAPVLRTLPYSFHRRTVLGKAGRDVGARLLRYGDPLLTGIDAITRADDRGRSFAMWREASGYEATDAADIFFRFDFLAETDLTNVLGVLDAVGNDNAAARAALRRRGDLALQPKFSTMWLNTSLEVVSDPALRTLLEQPYQPDFRDGQRYRDTNINSRRWPRLNRLGIDALGHWAALCAKARSTAEQELRRDEAFVASIADAARRAAQVDYGRLTQLEARAAQEKLANDAPLAFERFIAAALQQGILVPQVRLDTIGAVFLTGSAAATERMMGGQS